MPQNMIEKIAGNFAVDISDPKSVRSGDFIFIKPAHVMTHDNTGAVIPKFKEIGAQKANNPRQIVHALDHNIQDKTDKNLEKYKKIEDFSRQIGADFYPAGRGIGHQIMCEEGYAFPGTMVVASDSHSNMYGGLGCLGTPIVRTDAAAIWATGKTWWQVPPITKVVLDGKMKPGVYGKDVIIALCGFFNKDEVLNHAIEFGGEGCKELTIEERLTIANMSTEWGALAGVFPIDEVTIDWLRNRTDFVRDRGLQGVTSDADEAGLHPRLNSVKIEKLAKRLSWYTPDVDAYYQQVIHFDLSSVEPYVSGPNSVKNMTKVSEIESKKVQIHKAYLLSCVNGRAEDIAQAAKVLKGKKIASGVELYVAAASSEVQQASEKAGDWQILIDAGAVMLPPGCGPCIGLGTGLLGENQVGISATNRNFKGRMGDPTSIAYLASPAVVAASAIEGYICSPYKHDSVEISAKRETMPKPERATEKVQISKGFPEIIKGELIFCHQDNLNTDGIYPGKYTYVDDFKPADQAGVVMENYDPEFKNMAQAGDILVGGYNFGTGSSREQAATALKYKGISLVIAGSFSETYKRNALNNGFLAIEVPELTDDMKAKFGTSKLSVKTSIIAEIDFVNSVLKTENKIYKIGPVGAAAQELIVAGGLENWVKMRISN